MDISFLDGRKRDQLRLSALLRSLSGCLVVNQLPLFQNLINKYGEVKVLTASKPGFHEVLHDFIFYCFTKSCKSLMSIYALLEKRLPEDALILLRSVYENYLSVSYVFNHPETINDFVHKPVGLRIGRYKRAVNDKGRPIRNRIEDMQTGQIVPFGISIQQLSAGTRHAVDMDIHSILYPYLSEHTHPRMIASGNYRAKGERHYSYSNTGNILQPAFVGVYLGILILLEISSFQKISETDVKRLRFVFEESKRLVLITAGAMNFEKDQAVFPTLLRKRLKESEAANYSSPSWGRVGDVPVP